MYKALMIEDHKEVRDFVKEYFDHKEIEVIEAQNGYEGLAILDDTIDIILLDIMMPGIVFWQQKKQKKRFRKHQRLRQASLRHRMRQKIP